MSAQSATTINVRIVCISPPDQTFNDRPAIFGLQDKSQNLLSGSMLSDGSLQFDCILTAKEDSNATNPDWSGPYVHGTPKQRFLYLSWGYKEDEQWHWIKRIKIPLAGITWQQVQDASKNQHVVQARVDGNQAATVKLLDGGWSLQPR